MGSHAYRLKFPRSNKRHTVPHVSEIEPAGNDSLAGQVHASSLPIVIDGEEEWEIEEVVGSGRRYRKLEYEVKWVGDEVVTWQPAGDLEHASDMVELFHQKYPNKPWAEKG